MLIAQLLGMVCMSMLLLEQEVVMINSKGWYQPDPNSIASNISMLGLISVCQT